MVDIDSFLMFLGASFLLALAPGPDNIYVMTQGISKGKKEAILVSSGLASGVMVHTTAAALGVSVIFQTSQLAFDILKFIGALYLCYLGYLTIKHANDPIELKANKESSNKSLYVKGFFMNVLNPKVSLFFLAFLPTFTNPANGPIGWQMIILGVAFMVVTVITFSTMGILASSLGSKLVNSQKSTRYVNYATSGIFFILALKLATSTR